jgi:hypothetical protein
VQRREEVHRNRIKGGSRTRRFFSPADYNRPAEKSLLPTPLPLPTCSLAPRLFSSPLLRSPLLLPPLPKYAARALDLIHIKSLLQSEPAGSCTTGPVQCCSSVEKVRVTPLENANVQCLMRFEYRQTPPRQLRFLERSVSSCRI